MATDRSHHAVQGIDREQYAERLRLVITGAEGLHEKAQDVGDGKATIGWGYTFNRNNNVEIWRRSGIQLGDGDWRLLERIDRAPKEARTGLGLQFSASLDLADSDRLLRATLAEFQVPADRLSMPLSDERIALTSVAYNRGPGALIGTPGGQEHPVMEAIRGGDRAEAWYQIRYNCWGSRTDMEGGLRKRRFAEAQVFGLYDDPSNVGVEEARAVTAMHDRRRDAIDAVEVRFGDSINAPPARPNRIAQANRDYPALIALYGEVPTLDAALAPANNALARVANPQRPAETSRSAEREDRRVMDSPESMPSLEWPRRPDATVDPLLRQSQDAVRRLDGELGRTYDETSERMAASLALLARTNGLDRIDHAVLNVATESLRKGENVFVVQGELTDPTNRIARMKTQDAVARPVEQTLGLLASTTPAHDSPAPQHEADVQARQAVQRLTV